MNGEAGFIPPPLIFQVGALIAITALVPLLFIRKKSTDESRE
jgi:hypothetical protein